MSCNCKSNNKEKNIQITKERNLPNPKKNPMRKQIFIRRPSK